MPSKKLSNLEPKSVQPNVNLPTIPDAFNRSEYEGWLAELIKQVQLNQFRQTQAVRASVLRQIGEIQLQCLELVQNENRWRHLVQEERIYQKRLEIEELRLDAEIKALREPPPVATANPFDPIAEAISRIRAKIRTGAEALMACDQLKAQFPEYAFQIDREFRKLLGDLREEL